MNKMTVVSETPLARFVADLSGNKMYNLSTCWDAMDLLQVIDFLSTCCRPTARCTTNSQELEVEFGVTAARVRIGRDV